MLKNLLAAIGAMFLCHKAVEFYQEHSELKEESEQLKARANNNNGSYQQ